MGKVTDEFRDDKINRLNIMCSAAKQLADLGDPLSKLLILYAEYSLSQAATINFLRTDVYFTSKTKGMNAVLDFSVMLSPFYFSLEFETLFAIRRVNINYPLKKGNRVQTQGLVETIQTQTRSGDEIVSATFDMVKPLYLWLIAQIPKALVYHWELDNGHALLLHDEEVPGTYLEITLGGAFNPLLPRVVQYYTEEELSKAKPPEK